MVNQFILWWLLWNVCADFKEIKFLAVTTVQSPTLNSMESAASMKQSSIAFLTRNYKEKLHDSSTHLSIKFLVV